MKITVEIAAAEMKEICCATSESKRGPALRKFVTAALLLKRRQLLAEKFISGEWGVELERFEAGRAADLQAES